MDTGRPDHEPLNPQAPEPAGSGQPPSYQPPATPPAMPPTQPQTWQMAAPAGSIVVDGQLLVPAGLWPRVGAFLLDALILGILGQILATLTGFGTGDDSQRITGELARVLSGGQISSELETFMDRMMSFWLLQTAMHAAYFTLFYAYAATSLGKMALGLTVRQRDGQMLSLLGSFWRYVTYWISAKLLYSFWLIPFESQKRTLHDLMAGTNVFRAVPQQPVIS